MVFTKNFIILLPTFWHILASHSLDVLNSWWIDLVFNYHVRHIGVSSNPRNFWNHQQQHKIYSEMTEKYQCLLYIACNFKNDLSPWLFDSLWWLIKMAATWCSLNKSLFDWNIMLKIWLCIFQPLFWSIIVKTDYDYDYDYGQAYQSFLKRHSFKLSWKTCIRIERGSLTLVYNMRQVAVGLTHLLLP